MITIGNLQMIKHKSIIDFDSDFLDDEVFPHKGFDRLQDDVISDIMSKICDMANSLGIIYCTNTDNIDCCGDIKASIETKYGFCFNSYYDIHNNFIVFKDKSRQNKLIHISNDFVMKDLLVVVVYRTLLMIKRHNFNK